MAMIARVNLAVSEKCMPALESLTVIGTGFPERTDPNALVIGPTGVGVSQGWTPFGGDDPVLYVADTLNNRVAVIQDPFRRWEPAYGGFTLTSGGSLNGPLGLTVAPDGHIITVNGDDGYATEITPQGNQIAKSLLDDTGGPPPGNGALFGVLYDPENGLIYVDDSSNTLNKLQ
jgi:DNA-binding beta-propeller fold protein YncE